MLNNCINFAKDNKCNSLHSSFFEGKDAIVAVGALFIMLSALQFADHVLSLSTTGEMKCGQKYFLNAIGNKTRE